MVLYFNDLDNRPDAVSSAHWRDTRACSSDAPRLKAMGYLLIPDNIALPLLHKATRNFPHLIFTE